MISFEAIGTSWSIDIYDKSDQDVLASLKTNILKRIEEFDKNYSRFRNDSWVHEISLKAGKYKVPEDGREMFLIYEKLYNLTDGLFTPLIGKTIESLGYDANYSLKPREITRTPNWEGVVKYNNSFIETKTQILFDLGALGKGHLVDIVSKTIEDEGIFNYCVDAGGDIYYRSEEGKELEVGLEHPEDREKVIGVVNLLNNSICGSSGNRRKWDKYHHIVNPKTLVSPDNVLASWVVSKKTIIADAISTAIFFADPKKLQVEFEFEYLLLLTGYKVLKSANFPATLYFE